MKKLYFLLSALSVNVIAVAQYSMTNFHNVATGDVATNIAAADTLAQEGPGGANQTWNFSTMALGSAASTTYISPSGTPYASNYPNATTATNSGAQYGYIKCDPTSYSLEGAAQTNSTVIYTNDQVIMTYPFTYNTVVNDNFSGNIISGQNGTLTGTSTTTGDGYGTLVLPGATLNNVLRVKNVYTRTDNFGVYTIDYYSETYIWYSALSKHALMTINRFATTFFGSTTWVKTVSINAAAVGIEEVDQQAAFRMFPNPSAGEVFVQVKPELVSDLTTIEVVDLLGKTVYSSQLGTLSQPEAGLCMLNTASLEKGSYFVRISSGKASTVQKLIVQ